MSHTIVILGGGFAGIRAALDLAKSKKRGQLPLDTRIILISNKDYFEYYPAMYRVATGASPLVATVPLRDIIQGDAIEVIEDTITAIDISTKTVTGSSGSIYKADDLVLALGSQNNFFAIPGLEEVSYNFRSIHKAIELKNRIDDMFLHHQKAEIDEQLVALHFAIVGAGASGVELAGDLAAYARRVAKKHNLPASLVTIDLIEAAPRVLPQFSETVSRRVEARLRTLGIHILLNRSLIKGDTWSIFLKDMTMGAKTIVWTAGVKTHDLVQAFPNVTYSKKNRLVVNDYLELPQYPGVYALGDIADTRYAGLAQTALVDGAFVARNLVRKMRGQSLRVYKPQPVAHDIPVGPGWGVLVIGGIPLFGKVAWWMRQLIDIRFFSSILPIRKVIQIMRSCKE